MADADDDVELLRGTGKVLPKGALAPNSEGVDYLFLNSYEAADGKALLAYLGNPNKCYVLKNREGGWKLLTEQMQAVPRVDNRIHAFVVKGADTDDDVALLRGTGEILPKGPLDPDSEGVDKLFLNSYEAANGKALLAHLENPTKCYVLKNREGGWKLLTEQMQAVPRVDNRIHAFVVKGPDWTDPSTRVQKLRLHLGRQLQRARVRSESTLRSESGPLELDEDGLLSRQAIGSYFIIKGRRCTLETLIGAAAEIFNTYLTNMAEDSHKRMKFFAMMVAYPGAGKTTIGTDFPRLLRTLWLQNRKRVEQVLRVVWKSRDHPNKKAFMSMVDESINLNFQICMYHSLVASPEGDVLLAEKGLSAESLLALRSLHAALTSPACEQIYQEFLESFERLMPGLKQHLRFQDVVSFIREEYRIPKDKRILLSWFFDELNAARAAQPDQATWAQNMLSCFVDWAYSHRAGGNRQDRNTFVVISGATTKFSASSMLFTCTGRALAIFVPTRSLLLREAEEVVNNFLGRLATTLHVEAAEGLPPVFNVALPLTGGHPRLIAYLLRAVHSTLSEKVDPRIFWEHLQSTQLTPHYLETIISRLLTLMETDRYFTDYSDPSRLRLIMAVIRTSLLARPVKRSGKILEPEFNDTYGDAEAQGLLAFGMDTLLNLQGHVSFSNLEDPVFFSPLLLKLLFQHKSGGFGLTMPRFHTIAWRDKEIDDMFGIRFNVLLYKELYGDKPFRLDDILPSNWTIPSAYSALEFCVPVDFKEHAVTGKLDTLEKFIECMAANKDCWAFLGPASLTADSWLILTELRTREEFYIFIKSKSSTKTIEDHKMISKMVKDLKIWVRIPVEDVDIEVVEGLPEKRATGRVVDYENIYDDDEDDESTGDDTDDEYVLPSAQAADEDSEEDESNEETDEEDPRIPLRRVLFVYETEENVRVNAGGSWLKRHLVLARHAENSPWWMLSKVNHLLHGMPAKRRLSGL